MNAKRELSRLKKLLNENPQGLVPDDKAEEIIEQLALLWSYLNEHNIAKTYAYKLHRAEDLCWEPPILSFKIERHGAMSLGSSRAELHRWNINIDKGTADMGVIGYRQIYLRACRLKTGPIAEEIAYAIVNRAEDERLRWTEPEKNEVRIRIGRVIPSDGPKQTVNGRRRRLRHDLTEKLKLNGWILAKPNHYRFNPATEAKAEKL